MITGISGFGFFCPKMAVSWLRTVFHKMGCWNPYFYSVFGCAFFGQVVKKGKFWTPTKKKRKTLTDNWKALFWYFCVFFCFFVLCFLFFAFFLLLFVFDVCSYVFFGGFKGQVRWSEGPPHLALNPPYFFSVSFFCFFFFLFCFLFGGFKDQVRWPKGWP